MGKLRVAASGLLACLMFAQGVACAAAALLGQGGRFRPGLDILTHFAPFWLAGALVVVAYALLLAAPRLRLAFLLLGGVGTIAALSLVAPEFLRPTSPRAPPNAPDQLKVIQFNAWGRNDEINRTAQWVADQDADIVVMEEARPAMRDAVLARRPYVVTCPRCSVVIFSKATPIASGAPRTPRGQPRPPIALATFSSSVGDFTVVGTHYTWPTDGALQQRQGQELGRILSAYPKDTMILSGDFNSTPWSFSRRREDQMFGMERRTKALFSWPAGEFSGRHIKAPFPFLPIDHVYAGKAWRTVSVKRGPRLGSDHYPVIVTLAHVP
ncbi:MAG: endonuclease/exonuclease/phosphatase family protein [Phenylobacterium sp.]|uniref:endonuclease/exonuclease/phosphatase family protein n=1 Tax=Phenylobacterium sp. TaxID=1871053 RepID=UPI003BB5E04E